MWKIGALFLCVLCSLLSADIGASGQSPSEQYPNRLISPDFGIVTSDDLAYAAQHRYPTPYDSSKDLMARYWQCVPTETATPKVETWRGENGMDRAGVEILMCTVGIHVTLPEGRNIYGDRRGHPIAFCQEFERNWRRVTQAEKEAIMKLAVSAHKTLGLSHYSMVDMILTKRGLFVLEVDSLPALGETHPFSASLASVVAKIP